MTEGREEYGPHDLLVLDCIEGIAIPVHSKRFAHLHGLWYLPSGLHALARSVRHYEIGMHHRWQGHPPVLAWGGGGPAADMLACLFQWFSTSLVNYLRLVGLVDLFLRTGYSVPDLRDTARREEVKEHCRAYVKRVTPEVLHWRNKVAAHFALTDPWAGDNLGTLEQSTMNPVSYHAPYYYVGAYLFGSEGEEAEFPRWSLTETFESLGPRLWPRAQLPAPDSITSRSSPPDSTDRRPRPLRREARR